MKITKLVIISSWILLACILTTSVFAKRIVRNFTPTQKAQIEQIIHDYLVQNPDVLVEATKTLQSQQEQQMNEYAVKVARQNTNELFRSNNSPVVGNPDGTVTMVAFLDYQCPFCRDMASMLVKLIQANKKDLRVVFKEFPIHGKYSVLAAQAALAANMQGKYWQLHNALMKLPLPLSAKSVTQAAKSVGLNMKQLETDMRKDIISQEIAANYALVRKLKLIGTPTYFFAKTDVKDDAKANIAIISGSASQQKMQAAIDQVSK
jgi:protein-disulfide isomerase